MVTPYLYGALPDFEPGCTPELPSDFTVYDASALLKQVSDDPVTILSRESDGLGYLSVRFSVRGLERRLSVRMSGDTWYPALATVSYPPHESRPDHVCRRSDWKSAATAALVNETEYPGPR